MHTDYDEPTTTEEPRPIQIIVECHDIIGQIARKSSYIRNESRPSEEKESGGANELEARLLRLKGTLIELLKTF